jgi:integrase
MAKGKRAHGEGTYKKRKDGRWEAQYTIYTPSGTKRKSLYGHTKVEVAAKLRKVLADRDGGVYFDAENLSLGEYMHRWLEGSVKGSVWHTTYRDYAGHVRNHIAPELGRLKLAKLTSAHVQALYRKKLDSGLSPRTVNYIHATLHKALEQVFTFLRAAREAGDRFEALYAMAAFTGMRPGELLALRWHDVILGGPEPVARVRRSLSKGPDGPVFKPTKTEKGRSVSLLSEAVERSSVTASARPKRGSNTQDCGRITTSSSLPAPAPLCSGPISPSATSSRSSRRLGCRKRSASTILGIPSLPGCSSRGRIRRSSKKYSDTRR